MPIAVSMAAMNLEELAGIQRIVAVDGSDAARDRPVEVESRARCRCPVFESTTLRIRWNEDRLLDRRQDSAEASNALGRRGLDVGRPLRPEIDRDQKGGRRDQAPGHPAAGVGEPQGDERREGRGPEQRVGPDRPPGAKRHDDGGAKGKHEGGEKGDVPGHPSAARGPCLATGESLQAHRGEHGHRQRGEYPARFELRNSP